jgi:hypothetical protein
VATKIRVDNIPVGDVVSLVRNLSRKIAINAGDYSANHISSKAQKNEDLRKNINIIVESAEKIIE